MLQESSKQTLSRNNDYSSLSLKSYSGALLYVCYTESIVKGGVGMAHAVRVIGPPSAVSVAHCCEEEKHCWF